MLLLSFVMISFLLCLGTQQYLGFREDDSKHVDVLFEVSCIFQIIILEFFIIMQHGLPFCL